MDMGKRTHSLHTGPSTNGGGGGQGRGAEMRGEGSHDQGAEEALSSERRLAVFWTN